MGFRAEVVHLPNFVNIEDFVPSSMWKEQSLTYVGRLSREKGLCTLLAAAKGMNHVQVKIIGDGPAKKDLEETAMRDNLDNVFFAGYKYGEELKKEIRNSIACVLPSEWYENNPCSIIEAFALGKPVIGARIGGIPELVKDGETGVTFEPGDAADLRRKIEFLLKNPDLAIEMGKNARRFVEEHCNPENYYQKLMKIYQKAKEKHT